MRLIVLEGTSEATDQTGALLEKLMPGAPASVIHCPCTEEELRCRLTEDGILTEEEAPEESASSEDARSAAGKLPLRARTFGNFEVYHGDEPLRFRYRKTKELLAYLIDRRGSMCSNGELITILWGGDSSRNHQSYLKNIKADLLRVLRSIGCDSLIVKERGGIAVLTDRLNCDYYEVLSGNLEILRSYLGEYMSQYEWSEVTHSYIENLYVRNY